MQIAPGAPGSPFFWANLGSQWAARRWCRFCSCHVVWERSNPGGRRKLKTWARRTLPQPWLASKKRDANLGHQATAEHRPFDDAQLAKMMSLARSGIESLIVR